MVSARIEVKEIDGGDREFRWKLTVSTQLEEESFSGTGSSSQSAKKAVVESAPFVRLLGEWRWGRFWKRVYYSEPRGCVVAVIEQTVDLSGDLLFSWAVKHQESEDKSTAYGAARDVGSAMISCDNHAGSFVDRERWA